MRIKHSHISNVDSVFSADPEFTVLDSGIWCDTPIPGIQGFNHSCVLSKEAFIEAFNKYIRDAKAPSTWEITNVQNLPKQEAALLASDLATAYLQILDRVRHLDHGNMFNEDCEKVYNYCKDEVLEIIDDCLKGIV